MRKSFRHTDHPLILHIWLLFMYTDSPSIWFVLVRLQQNFCMIVILVFLTPSSLFRSQIAYELYIIFIWIFSCYYEKIHSYRFFVNEKVIVLFFVIFLIWSAQKIVEWLTKIVYCHLFTVYDITVYIKLSTFYPNYKSQILFFVEIF